MSNIKIILGYIWNFIKKVTVGLVFVLILGIANHMIVDYDFALEWLIITSYFVVGLGVLYAIGDGMTTK